MMEGKNTFSGSSAANVVDDAVGVPESYWFVAIVNHNSEKKVAEKLTNLQIEHYLPLQTEYRVWRNGRKAKVDRVVIPCIIFVRCTEEKRREIVSLPFINRFMTNKARVIEGTTNKPLAVIPDNQISSLKFMIGNSDSPISISERPFKSGDRVRVIRGKLKGLEGEVIDLNCEETELIVAIDFLGCAKLTIETINVEVLKDNT